MSHIKFTWPDDDDPIFSGAFTVVFPIQSEKSTEAGQPAPGEQEVSMTQSPYVHSPEEGTPEAEQQPWRIHIPLGSETEAELDEENPPPQD